MGGGEVIGYRGGDVGGDDIYRSSVLIGDNIDLVYCTTQHRCMR